MPPIDSVSFFWCTRYQVTGSAVCVDDNAFTDCDEILTDLKRILRLLTVLISTENTYWIDLLVMFGIAVVWFAIGFIVSLNKANQDTKIYQPTETKNNNNNNNTSSTVRHKPELHQQAIAEEENKC